MFASLIQNYLLSYCTYLKKNHFEEHQKNIIYKLCLPEAFSLFREGTQIHKIVIRVWKTHVRFKKGVGQAMSEVGIQNERNYCGLG